MYFCFSMILEPENETEYSTCPSNWPKARWLFRRPADRGHAPARRSWLEGKSQPRLTGSPVSCACPQSLVPSVGLCRLASVLFNLIVKISIENKIVHYRKIKNWRYAGRKTVGHQSYPLEVRNFIFWNIFPFSDLLFSLYIWWPFVLKSVGLYDHCTSSNECIIIYLVHLKLDI